MPKRSIFLGPDRKQSHKNPFVGGDRFVSLSEVREALGEKRVVTPAQAAAAWDAGGGLIETETIVRATKRDLDWLVAENAHGEKWYAVWLAGRSIAQTMIRGFDSKSSPFFYSGAKWALADAEKPWAEKVASSRMAFLNFDGKFGCMPHARQTEEVGKLALQRPGLARANGAYVLEAWASIMKTHGDDVLRGFWHWTDFETSGHRFVCVGLSDKYGVLVDADDPTYDSGDSLRVLLSWEFQG